MKVTQSTRRNLFTMSSRAAPFLMLLFLAARERWSSAADRRARCSRFAGAVERIDAAQVLRRGVHRARQAPPGGGAARRFPYRLRAGKKCNNKKTTVVVVTPSLLRTRLFAICTLGRRLMNSSSVAQCQHAQRNKSKQKRVRR